jgi:hypothetical protein
MTNSKKDFIIGVFFFVGTLGIDGKQRIAFLRGDVGTQSIAFLHWSFNHKRSWILGSILLYLNIMSIPVYYSTVSEAIKKLREKGYTVDFNLEENCLVCNTNKYEAEDFEITEVYRYEGQTDPADEATVYGIASKQGEKGILVSGYGANMNSMTEAMLSKLSMRE